VTGEGPGLPKRWLACSNPRRECRSGDALERRAAPVWEDKRARSDGSIDSDGGLLSPDTDTLPDGRRSGRERSTDDSRQPCPCEMGTRYALRYATEHLGLVALTALLLGCVLLVEVVWPAGERVCDSGLVPWSQPKNMQIPLHTTRKADATVASGPISPVSMLNHTYAIHSGVNQRRCSGDKNHGILMMAHPKTFEDCHLLRGVTDCSWGVSPRAGRVASADTGLSGANCSVPAEAVRASRAVRCAAAVHVRCPLNAFWDSGQPDGQMAIAGH
jgi:hypothetical protein